MKPPINPRRTLAAWVVAASLAMVSSQLHAQCTSGCLARIAELERSIAADEATLRALGSSGPQVIVGDGSGPGQADSYRQSIAAKRNAIQLYRQQHTRCGAPAKGLGGVGINGDLGAGVPLPSTGNADQAARMVEVVGVDSLWSPSQSGRWREGGQPLLFLSYDSDARDSSLI